MILRTRIPVKPTSTLFRWRLCECALVATKSVEVCLFSQTAYPFVSHNCKQPTTFLGESIEFMHTHAYICWQLQRRKRFGFIAWKATQSLVTIAWCHYASPWFKITRNYASPNWSPDDERTELRMQIGFVNAYSNVKYRTEVRQDQCARPS